MLCGLKLHKALSLARNPDADEPHTASRSSSGSSGGDSRIPTSFSRGYQASKLKISQEQTFMECNVYFHLVVCWPIRFGLFSFVSFKLIIYVREMPEARPCHNVFP